MKTGFEYTIEDKLAYELYVEATKRNQKISKMYIDGDRDNYIFGNNKSGFQNL